MAEALMDCFDDPVMFGPKQLVSSSKLVRNLSSYLDAAQKKPIFVAREQEVEAVLMSLNDYRHLLMEEEKVEKLYHMVFALRRMVEYYKDGDKQVLGTEELLDALGFPGKGPSEVCKDDENGS